MNEPIKNLEKVIEFQNDHVDVHSDIDIVMADAYDDSIKASKHIQAITDELERKNDAIKTENPPAELKVENEYTKVLTLDESIEDFNVKHLKEDGRSFAAPEADDRDEEYLSYDMARFVSGLCGGEDYPKPLSPLGHPMKRFQSGSRDKYKGTADGTPEALVGTPQVVPNEKYVTVHAQRTISLKSLEKMFDGDKERAKRVYRSETGAISPDSPSYEPLDRTSEEYDKFLRSGVSEDELDVSKAYKDLRDACKIYELEYTDPIPKRSRASHWDYSMKVLVPQDDSGLPMELLDYFGGLRDKGNPYFVGLTDDEILYKILPKDFVKSYLNYMRKVKAEQDEMVVEHELDKTIRKAYNDNTRELEDFLNDLFASLDSQGLTYDAKKLTKNFYAAFEDEWEEDEESNDDLQTAEDSE